MSAFKYQKEPDAFFYFDIPFVVIMLFLLISLSLLYVFSNEKEIGSANAVINQNVVDRLSVWSQNQPDKEWAKDTVSNYYSCLGMKRLGLSIIPFFCMPDTKGDSFKLTVQDAVAEAKVAPKFKESYTGFFNKLM